jgi:hypothetical protein
VIMLQICIQDTLGFETRQTLKFSDSLIPPGKCWVSILGHYRFLLNTLQITYLPAIRRYVYIDIDSVIKFPEEVTASQIMKLNRQESEGKLWVQKA